MAEDNFPARSTRSSKAVPTQAQKQPVTTAGGPKKKQVSASAATTKAKQASQHSAPPKARGKAAPTQAAAGGPLSKKQDKSRPNLANSQRVPDSGDNSNAIMINRTGVADQLPTRKASETQQLQKAANLKRKSSARSLSGTRSAIEDALSDHSPAAEAPRPKKSKSSLALRKQASTGALNRTHSVSITPASRSPSTMVLDELPPVNSSKPKKGSAPQKNAVVAAQKVVLEKENGDLKALLAAAEAEVKRLQQEKKQSNRDLASKHLIPRPLGERGKNGWNLQANMGLAHCYDLYSNIRVKETFPYMERFANNWATREFIKGICQNARRHCRKKGIKDPTLPTELLEGNNNGNEDANDGAGNENDNGDGDENDEDDENDDENDENDENDDENDDDDENENGDENDNGGESNDDDEGNENDDVNPSDAEANEEEDNHVHVHARKGTSFKASSALAKAKVSVSTRSTKSVKTRRPPMAASEPDSEDASMNSPCDDEEQDFDNPGSDTDGSETEE